MMGEGAFKRKKEPDVVVHACNPSTREAEFKASLSTIVKRCLKEREREREKKKEEEEEEEEGRRKEGRKGGRERRREGERKERRKGGREEGTPT
jgi:hypothetical protein